MIGGQDLLRLFTAFGFHGARICKPESLPARFASYREIAGLGRGSFVLGALSCYRREADDLSAPGDPHGLISPFARRNYYKEAVRRLKKIVWEISKVTSLAKQAVRIFCNSRLPEKALATASGLGFYGKNGLVISPGLGSLFIIAGLFLPLDLKANVPPAGWAEKGKMCGTCRACIEACPAGALKRPGIVSRKRCFQTLASKAVDFSPGLRKAWAFRLYGCQTCQDACPFNRDLTLETETELGLLGPSISLKEILSLGGPQVKEFFQGTQLGLSWVESAAIRRNAILAAGNRRDPVLIPELEVFLDREDTLLKSSAGWALSEIRA